MAAMTELKGSELGSTKVRVESGPVRAFANAVKDASPQYAADGAIVPPTFPFSWSYWGTIEGSTKGLPIEKLRGPGRMILHGEQEFVYHRQPKVGDVLEGHGPHQRRVREGLVVGPDGVLRAGDVVEGRRDGRAGVRREVHAHRARHRGEEAG